MTQIITDIYNAFCQEAILIIVILANFILNFIFGKKFFKIIKPFTIISIILVLISSLKIQIIPTYYAFNGAYVSNFYTVFFKILIIICALIILLISKNVILKRRNKILNSFNLMLLITLGAITLIASNDFLTLFVTIQLMGLSTFGLMIFSKGIEAQNSSKNYLINYLFSSCITLLGISYIYLSTGSLNFDVIYSLLNKGAEFSPIFDIGCILCALGLSFYICVIPFSNWIPNSFEKINKTTSLFISIIPVIAGFSIISRLIVFIFQYTPMLQAMLFIIGIFSIYKGLLGLLRQDDLYGFMGYSLSAQSGFILLGFCLANPYAVSTAIFYIFSYIITTIGAYLCLNLMIIQGKIKTISDLKGLVYKNKFLALIFAIFMLSFAGLPLTVGFLAKIYLFGAIIKCTNLYLAFLGIIMIATVIGIYSYFKPIKEMFIPNEKINILNTKFSLQKFTLYTCLILLILVSILPDKIVQICQFIAYQL